MKQQPKWQQEFLTDMRRWSNEDLFFQVIEDAMLSDCEFRGRDKWYYQQMEGELIARLIKTCFLNDWAFNLRRKL